MTNHIIFYLIVIISVFTSCHNSERFINDNSTKHNLRTVSDDTTYQIDTKNSISYEPVDSAYYLFTDQIDLGNYDSVFCLVKVYYSTLSAQNIKSFTQRSMIINNLSLLQLFDSIYTIKKFTDKINLTKDGIEKYCDSNTIMFLIKENYVVFQNEKDTIISILNTIYHQNIDLFTYYSNLFNLKYFTSIIDTDESNNCPNLVSPLITALSIKNCKFVELIYYKGYQFNLTDVSYSSAECFYLLYNDLISRGFSEKLILKNSLFKPCQDGSYKKVQKLLAYGADLNETDSLGQTPIFYTLLFYGGWPCCSSDFKDKYKVAKLLIANKVNLNVADINGVSPLMMSTKFYTCDGIWVLDNFTELFLKNNADITHTDKNGKSFWDYILLNNNFFMLRKYIKSELLPKNYVERYDSLIKTFPEESWDGWIYPLDGWD